MPVLNPQQAFNLIKYSGNDAPLITFLKLFLPIASENVKKNKKMILVHQNFVEFVLGNIKKFIQIFNITNENIKYFLNLGKNDIYKVLLDIIQSIDVQQQKKDDISFDKIYLNILSNTFLQSIKNVKIDFPDEKPFFFVPFCAKKINCFISSKTYSIITYVLKEDKIKYDDVFLINLLSYIISASGHLIIFCFYQKNSFENFDLSDIKFNLFAESHIFTQQKYYSDDEYTFDFSFLKRPFAKQKYIYFYSHSDNRSNKFIDQLEKNKNGFIKVFTFSKKLRQIFKFKKDSIKKASGFKPKKIDISGFLKDNIPINLCNVPLYKSDDRINDTTPEKISGVGICDIDPDDFVYSKSQRVHISIDGDDEYFIEFDDLHLMNPELYIAEPMYLSKEDFDIYTVEKVKDHYKDNTSYIDKQRAKNKNISQNTYEKMLMSFHYLYKYTVNEKGVHLEPYTSQIYAVYRAIQKLQFQTPNNKGIILQVQTGEGKSFIVQALAEHLARQDNYVHIATSNIILAARDFEKSYDYFRKTERKFKNRAQKHFRPSILIHREERKFIQDFLDNNKEMDDTEKKLFYTNDDIYTNNATGMNISVCLNDKSIKSNIVYSTFLNFEAFYLNQYEKNPGYIQEYMNNCYLIIDEADTILIDELTNGTILSKPMKSNAADVLELIYKNYTSGNTNEDSVLKLVIDEYPECVKMTKDDILRIFSDIKKVISPDFTRGSKYCIIADKKTPNSTRISKATKNNPQIICPFDSEHKGIVEENKEFSGFIHQLIGIKEKRDHPKENENLVIQPLSMNYLFISHPIYVNKYKGVCGVTGTIGTQKDKDLLSKFYKLTTSEIPRHQMNLRNDLPMILCRNIDERNKRICTEVKNLHNNQYPVLVVFNNYTEIDTIEKMLINDYGIKSDILIFDGRSEEDDESVKHKLEDQSGRPGAITLGTNFCGRGVSIEYVDKPLFVIVSYYNEDKRSINQVLGRAGRNGNPGMTRIICTKMMFYSDSVKPSEKIMKSILKEFEVKNSSQVLLINKIKDLHPWIFDESQYTDKMDKSTAYRLRDCQINVNRITAYNFKFPICMKLETFFDIQSQRIFSIKNCPECKYTWNLFRNYMRELIYESWSIFIDSVDNGYKKMIKEDFKFGKKDYSKHDRDNLYLIFFKDQYEEYEKLLFKYISKYHGDTVIDTFMRIHDIVVDNYENLILSNIPDSIRKKSLIKGKKESYTSFRIGFFPMNLAENSGAKLTDLSPSDQKKADKGQLYIIDPELKYIKSSNRGPFSITKILDDIFINFQEVVDKNLQGLFGVRFFLRRTLGGCEFGICVVPPYVADDQLLNCLVDRNPLIMLTICTKSTFFWIMGTLIIVLFFVITICTLIFTKYLSPAQLGSKALDILKKIGKKIFLGGKSDEDEEEEGAEGLIGKGINLVFDKIVEKLKAMIQNNIEKNDLGLSVLFETMINMFIPMGTDGIDEKLTEKLFSHFKINESAMNYMKGLSLCGKLIKIGILFVILIATFVMNFKHKIRLNYDKFTKDTSSSYEKERKSWTSTDVESFYAYRDTESKIRKEIKDKDLI